jgi:bacteriorhodopsin
MNNKGGKKTMGKYKVWNLYPICWGISSIMLFPSSYNQSIAYV